jgi:transcriptional regulator with XRE-family HTH domain
MGRTPSERPARLAEKLTQLRKLMNLSQSEMVRQLGLEQKLTREDISKYERGLRVPPLLMLLRYAKAAGVFVDVLIDDELDLPAKLPANPKSEGIVRRSASKSKRNR